jgi:hypothetical protein
MLIASSAVLGGLWLVVVFNGLVTSKNRVDEAWADECSLLSIRSYPQLGERRRDRHT